MYKERRAIFDVVKDKETGMWEVRHRNTKRHPTHRPGYDVDSAHTVKKEAVSSCRLLCERREGLGQWSQMVVRKIDGTIQYENTYPRSSDPRRSKG
jgi:hypothetical protein